MATQTADEKRYAEHARGWEAVVEAVHASKLAAAIDSCTVVRNRSPLADDEARAAGDTEAYHDVTAEMDAQVAAAREAVKAVVASGALGDGEVTASIKGFANPGNEPIEGHPADYVTIQLGRIAPSSVVAD